MFHRFLCGGDGVDGGHQTLDDLEVVVDDLGHRGQAVGGAAGVGDDMHGGLNEKKRHAKKSESSRLLALHFICKIFSQNIYIDAKIGSSDSIYCFLMTKRYYNVSFSP